MADWVEQWICIKFCIKLEHSSPESIWMIQKAAAMGNWWLAASSRQRTAHASRLVPSFLAKHQIIQVTQPPTAQMWHSATSGFSQNYNHLWKGRDFRPSVRFRKICQGSWSRVELCEVPRCLLWRGVRCHCPMYSVSCTFFNKCPYFAYYLAGYFLNRPHAPTHTPTLSCVYIYIWNTKPQNS